RCVRRIFAFPDAPRLKWRRRLSRSLDIQGDAGRRAKWARLERAQRSQQFHTCFLECSGGCPQPQETDAFALHLREKLRSPASVCLDRKKVTAKKQSLSY